MKVVCFSNLDLYGEQWPTALPDRPMVGDLITSTTIHRSHYDQRENHRFQLQLKVVRVTWEPDGIKDSTGYQPYVCKVELHMTDFHAGLTSQKNPEACKGSIYCFYEWYAPLVGKTISSFI